MALRNLEKLIDLVRLETENVEYSDTAGISQEEFIQYANDAQSDLQAAITDVGPTYFLKEKVITLSAGQSEIPMPDDSYLKTRIENLEYSESGQERDYYQVKQGHLSERFTSTGSTTPTFYILRGESLLLNPAPTNGGVVRITYQRALPRLDIRRAKVLSATTSGLTVTALNLDTSFSIDETELEEECYITCVDKLGAIKMQGIYISDVDSSLGTVTVDPSFVFESGETISAGNYLVRGKYASTHSQLNEACERYILAYMKWKILKRDSSNDASEAQAELAALRDSIVNTYKMPDNDVDYVPILDSQYLADEDGSN